MDNEDLTRLARWVIPGWVTIALFVTFLGIDYKLAPENRNVIQQSFGIKTLPGVQDTLSIIALLAALSVPLGFVIYQVYYYLRWNSPFSRDGSTPFFNTPGRMKEAEFVLADIMAEGKDKLASDKWRKNWVEHILFSINHKFKWQYTELLLYENIFKMKNGKEILSRYRYRLEILHTIGATSVAVVISYLAYLSIKVSNKIAPLSIEGIVYVFLSLAAYFTIHWLMNEENKVFRDLYLKPPSTAESIFKEKIKVCDDNHKETKSSDGITKADEEKNSPCGDIPTSFIKVGRFIVLYPTYMAVTWLIVVYVMSSSLFVNNNILSNHPTYIFIFMFLISIPLYLWISIHKKYKPTIIPNIIWFASIITASNLILYIRHSHTLKHSSFFPVLTTISSIAHNIIATIRHSHTLKHSLFFPVLMTMSSIDHNIIGTQNIKIEEIFADNGFLVNLLLFISVAGILSMNRSNARLEVISFARYIINSQLLSEKEAQS